MAADADTPAEGDDGVETDQHEGLLDRARGMGVGTQDPNIIGNAGPTDTAPGSDPPAGARD